MSELSIPYAADTSGWQDWQVQYRYGGFYLFPPDVIVEEVDALRARHDPVSHRICPAHVSLSDPLPRAMEAADLTELRAALEDLSPFVISYGRVHATPPHPGVVCTIEPVQCFMALRSAVHSTALFRDRSGRRGDIPPHMTIAEFISVEQSIALAEQLRRTVREGEWVCRNVDYAVPDDDMRFRRVLRIPLGS